MINAISQVTGGVDRRGPDRIALPDPSLTRFLTPPQLSLCLLIRRLEQVGT